MDIIGFVFGRPVMKSGSGLPKMEAAPPDVRWREVYAKSGRRPVKAHLAERDGILKTARGPQSYSAGDYFIVTYEPNDQAAVRRDVFERTYVKVADKRYAKRTDVRHRYFILPHPTIVVTPEGPERGDAGDWIMEDGNGGLYPISPRRAERQYQPAQSPTRK